MCTFEIVTECFSKLFFELHFTLERMHKHSLKHASASASRNKHVHSLMGISEAQVFISHSQCFISYLQPNSCCLYERDARILLAVLPCPSNLLAQDYSLHQLIEGYQNAPCLWDMNSEGYCDADAHDPALQRMPGQLDGLP
jgi:Alcohol dehydrogenase transcription factor Myb/SANT-like